MLQFSTRLEALVAGVRIMNRVFRPEQRVRGLHSKFHMRGYIFCSWLGWPCFYGQFESLHLVGYCPALTVELPGFS